MAKQGGNFEPLDWKRYQDNTFDVEINELITDEEIRQFATYLNTNVHEGKIIFEEEIKRDGLTFLDNKVKMEEGYLVPETYSKPMIHANTLTPVQSTLNMSPGVSYTL